MLTSISCRSTTTIRGSFGRSENAAIHRRAQLGVLLLELLRQPLGQIVKFRPGGIVGHAIRPYETHVLGGIEYRFVSILVDVATDETEVHGLTYDLGVVEEAEGLPIDGISEWH